MSRPTRRPPGGRAYLDVVDRARDVANHSLPNNDGVDYPTETITVQTIREDTEQLVIARAIFGMSVRERWTRSLAVMDAGFVNTNVKAGRERDGGPC